MRLGVEVLALLRNPETPDGVLRDALLDEGATVANVYVVRGFTGEYSDRQDWAVAAFLDEAAAGRFRDRLNLWCRENHVASGDDQEFADWEVRGKTKCPLDPNFCCDYTGTSYLVESVRLGLYE